MLIITIKEWIPSRQHRSHWHEKLHARKHCTHPWPRHRHDPKSDLEAPKQQEGLERCLDACRLSRPHHMILEGRDIITATQKSCEEFPPPEPRVVKLVRIVAIDVAFAFR